ncbi:MAG: hypothetical protein M1820_006519 [Bogoriella megaspora]|nr:MAG: hypothetical protein M1820_006519 [Bogoriella megaspora]
MSETTRILDSQEGYDQYDFMRAVEHELQEQKQDRKDLKQVIEEIKRTQKEHAELIKKLQNESVSYANVAKYTPEGIQNAQKI